MVLDVWSGLMLLSLVAMLAIAAITAYVVRRPEADRKAGLAFMALQLDLALWAAGALGCYLSSDATSGIFWLWMYYAGGSILALTWLAVTFATEKWDGWLSPRRLALLSVPSLVLFLSLLTNDWHHLFFYSIEYSGIHEWPVLAKGPLYWALIAVTWGCMAFGLAVFLLRARQHTGWQRRFRYLIVLVATPAMLANVAFVFDLMAVPADPTLLMISPAFAVCGYYLSHHWMENIVGTALADAARQMGDAVVVVDEQQQILDANHAFAEIMRLSRPEIVGSTVGEMVGRLQDQIANIDDLFTPARPEDDAQSRQCSMDIILKGPPARFYKMVSWPIQGKRQLIRGHIITLRDVTEARLAEKALRESEERYRDLFENATDIVFTTDLAGTFTSWNRSGERIMGYSLERDGNLNLSQIMAPDQAELAGKMIAKKLADPTPTSYELEVFAKGGGRITLEINSRLILKDGKPVGVQGIGRDVTEARALTRRLARSVADLEAVHETAIHLNSEHDLDGLLRQALLGVQRLARANHAELLLLNKEGTSFVTRAVVQETGAVEVTTTEFPLCPLSQSIVESGRVCFVADVAAEAAPRSCTMGDEVQAYAGVPLVTPERAVGVLYVGFNEPCAFPPDCRQVLQIIGNHASVAIANVQMFEDARHVAITDALTGLSNHRHLMDRLDLEMGRARRSGHPLAVMMMDIDDFKLVNDAHGHTVGDELLRTVSGVLRDSLRSTDIAGRYGGDEFLILLPETDREEADRVAQRLLEAAAAIQFEVPCCDDSLGSAGSAIPVRLSIGTAIYPLDSSTRLELISLADAAMYASKRCGGNKSTSAQVTNSGFLAAQNRTFSVLEALLNSVDTKDRYTRLHSERVAEHALALARALRLGSEVKRQLRIASLLHDVGKICIPDRILRKPGPLDSQEFEVVRQHPLLGEMIIREVPQLTEILDAVKHHHERYDGQGYPRGMKDGEIPLLARLIAVADAYSAMTLDRPYRKALSEEEAIAELWKGAGTQFDPKLVAVFVQTLGWRGTAGDQVEDSAAASGA